MKQSLMRGAAIAAGLAVLVVAAPAFAQTQSTANSPSGWNGSGQHGQWGGGMMMHGTPPAAAGKVTAINGTTLTVSGRTFTRPTPGTTGSSNGNSQPASTVTYTVDASSATIIKNNATSTLSNVAVGDFVIVQGTANGTSITATTIRDGVMPMMHRPGGAGGSGSSTPPVSPIQGNGEPVVAGTVSAISGTTLTVSNKSNVTYTVDASSAKIVSGTNTAAGVSNVTVGDSVIIQGTVNGTEVTASSIIDQPAPSSSSTGSNANAPHRGFFGSIESFFGRIFGF